MAKFEKCEAIGLKQFTGSLNLGNGQYLDGTFIRAEGLERVLSEGVEVFGTQAGSKNEWSQWPTKSAGEFTGLLIGVKQIQKDTAEQVLKDLVACRDLIDRVTYLDSAYLKSGESIFDLIERAKRLVGG